MNRFIQKTKSLKFISIILINLLIANAFLTTSAQTSFTLRQVLNAIVAVKEGRTTFSKIISEIKSRGVAFELTEDKEKELRNEGATDELIEAIYEKIFSTSKTKKLTFNQILEALDSVKDNKTTVKKVIANVKKNKVDFEITQENEKLLKEKGANEELISVIKQNTRLTTGLKILNKPNPNYTELARQNNVGGEVVLRVTFLENGNIGEIEIVKALPSGLTEQAISAAKNIRFKPALKDGVPQKVKRLIVYQFTVF